MWAALPGWRWLQLAGRLPGAARVMELTYKVFLSWRPTLERGASPLDRLALDRPNRHETNAVDHTALSFGILTVTAIAFFTGASGVLGRHWSKIQMQSGTTGINTLRGHHEPVRQAPRLFQIGAGLREPHLAAPAGHLLSGTLLPLTLAGVNHTGMPAIPEAGFGNGALLL